MADRNPNSEYEPVAIQPFEGVIVELVRRWHDHGGRPVPEHRYRARAGDTVIDEDNSYAALCARLHGRYPRGRDVLNLPDADRRSHRYAWLQ